MRGAVIAGGFATRFDGKPKGLEKVGGSRILDIIVERMTEALGDQPFLVANHEDAAEWHPGLEVVGDIYHGLGSLSGIYTAVHHSNEPVLLVAWDMPFVPTSLFTALISGAGDYDAFLPVSVGRRAMEPMCAVYGQNCAEPIRRSLENEDLRAIAFHDSVNVGFLGLDEVRKCGDPKEMFFNVNTAEDLKKAREICLSKD